MAPDLVAGPLFCGAKRAVFCNVQPALLPKPFIDSAGGFPYALPNPHLVRHLLGPYGRRRQRREAGCLRRRQRRLQERRPAAEPVDRREGDGRDAAQCRLRSGRGLQSHARQDDRAAARLRQEGARRRRRAVLLRRSRHRHLRHQLSVADRRRHQIRNGRQARRRHQYRPHARADHGRRQGQAGVPRRLPRQPVRRQDQVELRRPAASTCRPVLPK